MSCRTASSAFVTFGLLSPALKTRQLAAARQALAMPAANPQACEDAAAFLKRVAGIEASRTARTARTAEKGAG